jgi:hypothetical protein
MYTVDELAIETDVQDVQDVSNAPDTQDVQDVSNAPDTQDVQDVQTQCEVGPNCRINIADKREIVRLTEELEEAQCWFEQYGQDGILFPNSIINSFEPRKFMLAA